MSCWAHANIQMECKFNDPEIRDKEAFDYLKSVLGNELRFEDDEEAFVNAFMHPQNYLPLGSEGSLHLDIAARKQRIYGIRVWGNLRDVYILDDITNWLAEKVDILTPKYIHAEIYTDMGNESLNVTFKNSSSKTKIPKKMPKEE